MTTLPLLPVVPVVEERANVRQLLPFTRDVISARLRGGFDFNHVEFAIPASGHNYWNNSRYVCRFGGSFQSGALG